MHQTSRVLVAMGAATLLTYGTALAQAPAQPSQERPTPPSSASPSSSRADQADSKEQTTTGELLSVNPKEDELTIKTTTGEMTIKYDDTTKVTGASRNAAGLATMQGSQVTVRYKKDGRDNLASMIDVKPAAGAPGAGSRPTPGDRPTPGGDRPAPGGDRPFPDGDRDRPSPDGPPPTPRP